MQAYSDPSRASDSHALPDVEVFYQAVASPEWGDLDSYFTTPGYYYWYCFPGCMPDSDPIGPFASAEEAKAAAQDECWDFNDPEGTERINALRASLAAKDAK